MSDEFSGKTVESKNRRELLRGLAAGGAASVLLAGSASGRGRNGRDRSGGPPDMCSCPEGTFLAKYDFVIDEEECYFVLAEGEDVVEITDWEGKDGDPCEPVTFSYEAPGYELDTVCAFGGLDTHTDDDPDGDYESDLTNPGGQQAAISNVTFCGRPTEEGDCPDLTARYECTTYNDEGETFRRSGTRFRVTNAGGEPATYDLAVANEPGDWRESLNVGAETDQGRIADASVPTAGIVFWECANGEPTGAQTWGEYKDANGFADLEDWYEGTGSTGLAPFGAPQDVDDELQVVEVTGIPVGEPDEEISTGDFPDMSQAAEDEGWIACETFDS